MHSLHMSGRCVSLGQTENSLDVGGSSRLLSERLGVNVHQLCELTGCVYWLVQRLAVDSALYVLRDAPYFNSV